MPIIIRPLPRESLEGLQSVLEQENARIIADIWVHMCPFYLAAESDGCIVGVASISLMDNFAEIYKIYVVPSMRNQGIAKRLFDEALRVFRQNRINEFCVEIASKAGHAFILSAARDMKIMQEFDNKKIFHID